MSRPNIERFMAASEEYLTAPDEPASRVHHAARLLVREFTDAVKQGPGAMVSTPASLRSEQTTLANVFWRMLDDDTTLLVDLLEEMRGGSKDDIIEFLANAYASWVIASYDLKAFK